MMRFDEYIRDPNVGVTALEVFELHLKMIAEQFACDINKDVYITVSICADHHEPYVTVIVGAAQSSLDLEGV